MTTELYKPAGCTTLAETTQPLQIRLGIQSPPGLGKTFAALTFPNPCVLNYNKGLGAHAGRADVIDVPMWFPEFVDSLVKRSGTANPPNRKDALTVWIAKHGVKLTPQQTLVVDSGTEVESAFHIQYKLEFGDGPVSNKGSFNKFHKWAIKEDWYRETIDGLKSLSCGLVYICHETVARNDEGDLTGGARPLLTGVAGDKLVGDFTDWFRMHAIAKPIDDTAKQKMINKFGISLSTADEWIASTPREHGTIYLWQTQADEFFKCKTSSLFNSPKFVIANYATFARYKRTIKVA